MSHRQGSLPVSEVVEAIIGFDLDATAWVEISDPQGGHTRIPVTAVAIDGDGDLIIHAKTLETR